MTGLLSDTTMMDVDLGFEAFLWLFNTTLDKHAPIKKTYKKEEKDKTMGYQRNKKSMSVRDKIYNYKQMIKEKDKNIKNIEIK